MLLSAKMFIPSLLQKLIKLQPSGIQFVFDKYLVAEAENVQLSSKIKAHSSFDFIT